MSSIKNNTIWPAIITRGLLFCFLWWCLSGGALTSWWVGVPAIIIAVSTSIALFPPVSVVWYGCLRFIPFFILRSLLGGIDVARRVFQRDMAIAPTLFKYKVELPPGLPQVLMANTVGLLPGTLSAELDNNYLLVHVLDERKEFVAELNAVQTHIARIFGITLKHSG